MTTPKDSQIKELVLVLKCFVKGPPNVLKLGPKCPLFLRIFPKTTSQ